MTAGAIQTYAVIQERATVFQDTELSRVASGTYMVRGATFSGTPTDKNNTIHLANGSGFVPGDAVALCYRYKVGATTRILQDHRPDAQQAGGGSAFVQPGTEFDAAQIRPGWLWLLSGIGYIPADAAQISGVTSPALPGFGTSPSGQRVHTVQENDNLSTISALYYNGDQSRAMDIYNVPENKARIGSDPGFITQGMVLVIP